MVRFRVIVRVRFRYGVGVRIQVMGNVRGFWLECVTVLGLGLLLGLGFSLALG